MKTSLDKADVLMENLEKKFKTELSNNVWKHFKKIGGFFQGLLKLEPIKQARAVGEELDKDIEKQVLYLTQINKY